VWPPRPASCEDGAALRRTRVLLLLGAGVIAAAVVAILVVTHTGAKSPAHADAHRLTKDVPSSRLHRILDAADVIDTTVPSAELIAEGKHLFRDPALYQDGLSCQSCHTEGGANPDLGTQMHPTSAGDFTGPRDPPALWGVAETAPYLWTGSVPTLEELLARLIRNFFKDGNPTGERVAALAAYLRSLDPPVTSFDLGTMSSAALRGERLFQGKAGCISCHSGPLLTDNRLHNTLVPQAPGANDPGATNPPHAFNTPQLRDLSNTPPYMHNGVFTTLRQVVEFYDKTASTAPLNLTDQEMNDLVAYMNAL
jgi:cytochrome c peroxidase